VFKFAVMYFVIGMQPVLMWPLISALSRDHVGIDSCEYILCIRGVIQRVSGLNMLDSNIFHNSASVKRTSFTNSNESVADMTSL